MTQKRIIIITNGNYFARLILEDILEIYGDSISGVLIITGDYKARSGFRALFSLSKTTTVPYLVYKLITIFAFKIAQLLFPRAIFDVERQAQKKGLLVRICTSVNSDESITWINLQNPDLIISVSCPQLINQRILQSAKIGSINIHSSLLPSYAGLAPYYWVLSIGEKETGITVHYMTSKFDAGNILVQKHLSVDPYESAFHLFTRLAKLGKEALVEAVKLVFEGSPGFTQDLSKYTYYSNPSFRSFITLKRNGHNLIRLSELQESIRLEIKLSQIVDSRKFSQ